MLEWKSIEDKQIGLFSKDYKIPVIGVFKDINVGSLSQSIPPMIYRYKENSYPQYVVFRVEVGREEDAAQTINEEWNKIFDEARFEWFTVAERFDLMYGNEERISKIIGAFSLIAVLLSCFGLLASISFSIVRRTKEIGIRKVNGAGITELLSILNFDLRSSLDFIKIFSTSIRSRILPHFLHIR